jgi:AcrR family transcriptional regulator
MLNEKQQQILCVAEKLFSHHGFEGTSVRDIAEAADVNIAMISYYFGSKEKLMQALFQERMTEIKLKLEALLNDTSIEPVEKIGIVVDQYVDRVWEKQQFFKLTIQEQIVGKNKVITRWLKDMKKQNFELIGSIINDGQKKKIFKKGVDPILLVNTMTGTALQSFLNKDLYKHIHGLDDMSEETLKEELKEKTKTHIKTIFKAVLL